MSLFGKKEREIIDAQEATIQSLNKKLEDLGYSEFTQVKEAIDHLKSIKFQETYIIIRDKIFSELIKYFKENIEFMYVIPKIIIFSTDKKNFIENNKEFQIEEKKHRINKSLLRIIHQISKEK